MTDTWSTTATAAIAAFLVPVLDALTGDIKAGTEEPFPDIDACVAEMRTYLDWCAERDDHAWIAADLADANLFEIAEAYPEHWGGKDTA